MTKIIYGYLIYESVFTGEIWEENEPYDDILQATIEGQNKLKTLQDKPGMQFILVICKHEITEYNVLQDLSDTPPAIDMNYEESFEYFNKRLRDPLMHKFSSYDVMPKIYYDYQREYIQDNGNTRIEKSDKYSTYDYAFQNVYSIAEREKTIKCIIRKHEVSDVS